MSEYIAGDDASFTRLYEKLYPFIVAKFARQLQSDAIAEDCVQEAFVKAYKSWPNWKPTGSAESWIWQIASNVVKDTIRNGVIRTAENYIAKVGPPEETTPGPESAILNEELLRIVLRLPPPQAQVIIHRFWLGNDGRTTAKLLGRNERTVASQKRVGLLKLKELIEV